MTTTPKNWLSPSARQELLEKRDAVYFVAHAAQDRDPSYGLQEFAYAAHEAVPQLLAALETCEAERARLLDEVERLQCIVDENDLRPDE